MSDIPDRFTRFRDRMPVTERWAYFDHAAVAPVPGPTRDVMVDWAETIAREGSTPYPQWIETIENLRRDAAQLVGADRDEIALVANTTTGINIVAEGFPFQPGDNVITRADEFPSNLYPWMQQADRGVEVRRLPVGTSGRLAVDQILEACDDRTRIVTISWVAYSNGWRHDLDRLAEAVHERGILLFVDAIQGLGVFPLDVRQTPIDFLSADGHKWLLGPEGAGVFYIRRDLIDMLRATGVGWNSVVDPLKFHEIDLTLRPEAARFEGGTQNTVGQIGLGKSLHMLLEVGPEKSARRLIELTDIACERLAGCGAEILSDRTEDKHKSGIVTFTLPGRDPMEVRHQCLEQGVLISCRAGRLRISPHIYNNEEDIDKLIKALG